MDVNAIFLVCHNSLIMSAKERRRLMVFDRLKEGQLSLGAAARLLQISVRGRTSAIELRAPRDLCIGAEAARRTGRSPKSSGVRSSGYMRKSTRDSAQRWRRRSLPVRGFFWTTSRRSMSSFFKTASSMNSTQSLPKRQRKSRTIIDVSRKVSDSTRSSPSR